MASRMSPVVTANKLMEVMTLECHEPYIHYVGIPTTVKAAKTKWYRQGTLCKRAKVLESSVQLYM
jgi:hypothetical protein